MKKFLVIIGGSAGMLPALISFFDHTLPGQAAYIILQHLPMDFHSQLKAILQRHSSLSIQQATTGTMPQKATIYFLSGGQELFLENSHFLLKTRNPKQQNQIVDQFIQSLADNGMASQSIIVILSGAGADGSKYISRIHGEGGLIIAQTPEECTLPFMPLNTIRTGKADFVLDAANMPEVIDDYIQSFRRHY